MRRFLSLAAMTALAFTMHQGGTFAVQDDEANAGWMVFAPKNAGFSILVPSKPEERKIADDEIRYDVSLEPRTADLKFGYFDLPANDVQGKTAQGVLDMLMENVNVGGEKAQLLLKKKITVQNQHPGFEFLLQKKQGNDVEFERMRFVSPGGRRVFIVAMMGPKRGTLESPLAEGYFASFKIGAKGNVPPSPQIEPPPKPLPEPVIKDKTPPIKNDSTSRLQFRTFRDPREGAFSVQVPTGWQVKGGTVRPANLRVTTFRVEAVSPDGAVTIHLDMNEPGMVAPHPMLDALNIRDGGMYPDGGGGFIPVRRYTPGAEYMISMVLPKRNLQNLQVVSQREWKDLAEKMVAVPGFDQVHVGEVAYSFQRENRTYHGGALAATRTFESQPGGLRNWHCGTLAFYEAPADRESVAKGALLRMINTWQMDARWSLAMDATMKKSIHQLSQAGNEMSNLVSQSYWHKDKAYTGIFRADAEVRRGTVELRDPRTGEQYTMAKEPEADYFWIRPNGQTLATPDNRPPSIDAEPLVILDIRAKE